MPEYLYVQVYVCTSRCFIFLIFNLPFISLLHMISPAKYLELNERGDNSLLHYFIVKSSSNVYYKILMIRKCLELV